MKRTKILITLGPATSTEERIAGLVEAGADAFRINMSHGSHEQWEQLIATARSVAPDLPVVMDTKGPELRLLGVHEEFVLEIGEDLIFSLERSEKLPYLSHDFVPVLDQRILLDDGAIITRVVDIKDGVVKVRAESSGLITNERKVTIPGASTTFPVLDDKDVADLSFADGLGIDAVALSFTRSAKDVAECRKHVSEKVLVLAKIENAEGVQDVDAIVEAADGVMVARGDLGVEMPFEEVPLVQKRIVGLCNTAGKPVIVATQMLETMIHNPRPTRAEASDVANAIIDGADCCMLSGETAIGEYPVESCATMARIAETTDPTLVTSIPRVSDKHVGVAEAMSNAVYDISMNLGVDAIVSATASGFTARMVARFRPKATLVGVAHDQRVMRQLQLSWGVRPCVFSEKAKSAHHTIFSAVRSALSRGLIQDSDRVVATAGVDTMKHGSTNLIEVHTVSELLAFYQRHGDDDQK